MGEPMLELYTFPTPNALKVLIFLEECDVPYRLRRVDILNGEQFRDQFLAISPNNKVPAIVDLDTESGGPVALFESGAILAYLAERTGQFIPADPAGRAQTLQWTFWQAANQGPKFGENSHFRRARTDGDLAYAIDRFAKEVRRIYGVMERRLSTCDHIAGEAYSIADMMCYPWARLWSLQGVASGEFPHVAAWVETIASRPAVVRAEAVNAMPSL